MGSFIKEKCKEKGLTQKEFGDFIGVSQPQVSKIYNGDVKRLTIDVANKIRDCLEISLDEIFGEVSKF